MPVPVFEFPHYAGKSWRCLRQPLVHLADPRPQRQGRLLVNALTVHRAPPVRVLAITHAHYCSEQPAPTRPLLVPPDQCVSPLAPVSRPLPEVGFVLVHEPALEAGCYRGRKRASTVRRAIFAATICSSQFGLRSACQPTSE